jgi:hypothetical protein
MGPMSYRSPGVRLARLVTLSYHSGAIMVEDQKANRGDKN